jgi:hypothetical protein
MNDIDSDNFELEVHPAWRQAIKDFLAANFPPGHVVTFDWLYDAFKLKMPSEATTWGEASKTKLLFLSQFQNFSEHLLSEQTIALASVTGVGYRVLPPGDQTPWAEAEGRAELKRALRKLGRRISHVDRAKLTTGQLRENADAMARYSMLRGMTKQIERQPAEDEEQSD